MRRICCMLGFVLCFMALNEAQATPWSYGLSYVGDFSSCECHENSLDYADDQINQLDNQLSNAGMTKRFKFANTLAQSSDVKEDYYGGEDHRFADNVDLYAVTTHGGVAGSSYIAAYCSSATQPTSACLAYSSQMVFGELANHTNPLYATNPGKLRWLILSTCHSMDNEVQNSWYRMFTYGVDMLMGYKGTMRLGETTDETLADFAEHAFGGNSIFKNVWFSANDDWWIDNTAGIMTCGDPVNNTCDYSSSRMNTYTKNSPRRQIVTSGSFCCSIASHEG